MAHSDRRFLPTTGLALDEAQGGDDLVVGPRLSDNLDAEWQAGIGCGRASAHNPCRPAGRVVLARITGATTSSVAAPWRLVVERDRRTIARRADDDVVVFEPGELLALDRVHLLT